MSLSATASEVPENTILRVRTGSHAYGLSRPNSDQDESLVFVERFEDVVGVGAPVKVKHNQGRGLDRQEYPLRKFLYLASQGNPSVLEMFFAPVIEANIPGYLLRSTANAFIGRHVIPRYMGYMHSQTMRLLGLKGQLRVTREELRSRDGYDTKYAMHTLRLGWMAAELLSTGKINLPITDRVRLEYLRSVRSGDVPFDEWFDQVQMAYTVLESFKEDTKIPSEPDIEKIVRVSESIHRWAWEI